TTLLHHSTCFAQTNTSTAAIYTLSLHDALPISGEPATRAGDTADGDDSVTATHDPGARLNRHIGGAYVDRVHIVERLDTEFVYRSEEHTSELQSREKLVCRLLLEKKKKYHQVKR